MSDTKKSFNKLINKINELKISQKAKSETIDCIIDLVMSFQNETLITQNNIEKRLHDIEEYLQDDNDIFSREYTIKCPYCNSSVEVFMSKDKLDIDCPHCKNIIQVELDDNVNKKVN